MTEPALETIAGRPGEQAPGFVDLDLYDDKPLCLGWRHDACGAGDYERIADLARLFLDSQHGARFGWSEAPTGEQLWRALERVGAAGKYITMRRPTPEEYQQNGRRALLVIGLSSRRSARPVLYRLSEDAFEARA